MKYLIILNRFDMEDKAIEEKLKAKIIEKEKFRITVDSELSLEEISKLQEVKRVIPLQTDWTDFESFKNFMNKCIEAAKKAKIQEFNIVVKFLIKTRLSAGEIKKKVNTFLNKEGLRYSHDAPIFYIEFKDSTQFRIGIVESKYWSTTNILERKFSNFIVILENPESLLEVSDFLRLCWIFKVPLILLGDRDKNDYHLKTAKKITKGIDYAFMDIKFLNKIPKEYIKVGFSKYAQQNEIQLREFLMHVENKQVALIFGNDKYGLSQKTRDEMDHMYRLTPELQKPLRASHALSYILGIYIGNNI